MEKYSCYREVPIKFFFIDEALLKSANIVPALHLLGHDLDNESHSHTQHSVKQLGLSLDEHGKIHQQFLKKSNPSRQN